MLVYWYPLKGNKNQWLEFLGTLGFLFQLADRKGWIQQSNPWSSYCSRFLNSGFAVPPFKEPPFEIWISTFPITSGSQLPRDVPNHKIDHLRETTHLGLVYITYLWWFSWGLVPMALFYPHSCKHPRQTLGPSLAMMLPESWTATNTATWCSRFWHTLW